MATSGRWRPRTALGLGAGLVLAAGVLLLPESAAGAGHRVLGGYTQYGVGAAPSGVAVADLDRDGRADLVVTAGGADAVRVLRGLPGGGFAPGAAFATPAGPDAVVVADVTGDGRPDVVVADAAAARVSVFPGTGTATLLGPRHDYPVGADPVGVAAGDLDRDGRVDVVTANHTADTVSVLRATPTGFAAKRDYAVGAGPSSVAISSVTPDGRTDIVVADQGANRVTVLHQTVVGGFLVRTTATVGPAPDAVAIGDIDGDGRNDIVTANVAGRSISVLLNRGWVGFAPHQDHATGTAPRALRLADLDGDGRLDAVTAGGGPDVVTIQRGTGPAAFADPDAYPTGGEPQALAVADLNADGRPDVATVSLANRAADVLPNTGPGAAVATPPPPTSAPRAPTNPSAPAGPEAPGPALAGAGAATAGRRGFPAGPVPAAHRPPAGAVPTSPRAASGGASPSGPAGSGSAAPPRPGAAAAPPERRAGSRPHGAAAAFGHALPSPAQTTLRQVLQDSLLALILLALLSLPITLINDTAVLNSAELAAAAARLRRRLRLDELGERSNRLPVEVALTIASLAGGLLYAFLVPSFGWDLSSLALVVGLTLGLLTLTAVGKGGQRAFLTRQGEPTVLRLHPGFAAVALGCVLLSRLTGLHPGLLLGTLLSLATVRAIDRNVKGQAVAVSLATVGAVSGLAWVFRTDLVDAAGHAGSFAADTATVTLSSIVVGGAGALAFEVLPLTFVDGHFVFRWSKPAWAALAFVGAFAFVHLVLHPAATDSSLLRRTGYLLTLFSVYLAAALAFWGWFRFRPATRARRRRYDRDLGGTS